MFCTPGCFTKLEEVGPGVYFTLSLDACEECGKCVEVCPTGSRKFGNLLDPDSEIRYILEHKRVVVLKNELNTRPRFYYFFG